MHMYVYVQIAGCTCTPESNTGKHTAEADAAFWERVVRTGVCLTVL